MLFIDLELERRERPVETRSVPIRRVIIGGWTGRDKEALERHIAELEELGVKRPTSTPIFYRVAASRLTTEDTIQVSGTASSGEVEWVLVNIDGELWIGVGSDHTDREVETYNITVSKQMCDKPIAPRLWPLAEVEPHWDRLMLESRATIDGTEVLYQQGAVTAMLSPPELLAEFEAQTKSPLAPGDVIFGGTLAAIGGIRAGTRFAIAVTDTVFDRQLKHGYAVQDLPVVG